MEVPAKRDKREMVSMELSTFKIPPSGDVLILGKRCPVGAKAAKKMLDTVAPDQFELIQLEDDVLEAILVKKYLFLRADREALIKAIIEEAKPVMGIDCMLTVRCEITVSVKRQL